MKKIAVILSNSLNDYEIIIPVYLWKKMNLVVDLISIEKKNGVLLQSGHKLSCTELLNSVNLSQYDAVYIPGGEGVSNFTYETWPIKQPEIIQRAVSNLEKMISSKTKYLFFTHESINILNSLNLIPDNTIQKELEKIKEKEYIVNFNNIYVTKGYLAMNDFAILVGKLLSTKKDEAKITEVEKLIYSK